MKSKHTPGPWTVSEMEKSYLGDEAGSYTVSGPRGPVVTTDESYAPEALANAHLIAAAPEMIDALEMVLRSVDGDPKDGDTFVLDHVRQVIKRARGES